MEQAARHSMVLNLPNLLTYGRILAVPALVSCFFLTGEFAHWLGASERRSDLGRCGQRINGGERVGREEQHVGVLSADTAHRWLGDFDRPVVPRFTTDLKGEFDFHAPGLEALTKQPPSRLPAVQMVPPIRTPQQASKGETNSGWTPNIPPIVSGNKTGSFPNPIRR